MKKYKKRVIDSVLNEYLQASGAVVVEGPKWCGKTTTSLQAANSLLKMDDAENDNFYADYINIKTSKLLQGDTPRLIDEWQLAPKLWDAVRNEVDRRSKVGQFILTGSTSPADTSSIFHSGAGRFLRLHMRTMSLYESLESSGEVSLFNLFSNPKQIDGRNNYDIEQIAYFVCRGGWPFSLEMQGKAALRQGLGYYETVIRTEINAPDGITKNTNRVALLMRSLSRNLSSSCSINTIKNDIASYEEEDICNETINVYIQALRNIFVVEDMQAWNPNLRSKIAVRTSPTRYFTDPSIACAALGLGPSDLMNDLKTFGLFFEAMCVRDLRVYAQKLDGNVYHYRDKSELECDAVIHLRNGSYGLCEIKLGGERLIQEGVDSLKKLNAKIDTKKMKEPSFMMIITATGDFAYRREDGIYIVPITCLKD